MKFDNNIKLTLIIYVTICFAIYYIRPPFIFDSKGNFKQFVTKFNCSSFIRVYFFL